MHNQAYLDVLIESTRQGSLVGWTRTWLLLRKGMLISSHLDACGPPYSSYTCSAWPSVCIVSGSSTLGTMGCWLRPNKSGYDPVPSSVKWLGNQIPHTGYGPTTPSWRAGTTNLKRTRRRSNLHQSFLPSQWTQASRISQPISPV
jgi:hypothetical protein